MQHLRRLSLGVAVAGLCITLYTSYVYTQKIEDPDYQALCDISETLSCSNAVTSKFSKNLGLHQIIGESPFSIPNFLLGIFFYTFYILSILTDYLKFLLLPASFASVLVSIYLFYILNFVMKVVCLICYASYVVAFALFIVELKCRRESRDKVKTN